MIVRNCPDCGARMIWINQTKIRTLRRDGENITAQAIFPHHLCLNCHTAVDFKNYYKWKETEDIKEN